MNYHRKLEDKTRLTLNGKRYRVGNPSHPYHDLYKKHGIEAVIEVMGLVEVTPAEDDGQDLEFPWMSTIFGIAIVSLIIGLSVGSQ